MATSLIDGPMEKPLLPGAPSKKQRRNAKKAAKTKRLDGWTLGASSNAALSSEMIMDNVPVATTEANTGQKVHSKALTNNEKIDELERTQVDHVLAEQKLDWAADATAEAEANIGAKVDAPFKADVEIHAKAGSGTQEQSVEIERMDQVRDQGETKDHVKPTPTTVALPRMPAPLKFPVQTLKPKHAAKDPRQMTLIERQALTRGPRSDPLVAIWTEEVADIAESNLEQPSQRVGVVRKRLLEHFSKRAGKELTNHVRQDWHIQGITFETMSILLEWMVKSCGTPKIQNIRSHDITVEQWLNLWEAAATLDSETAQWKLVDQMYADIKSLSIPELLETWYKAKARGLKQLEEATVRKLRGIVRNKPDISLEELEAFWVYSSEEDHLMRKVAEAFARPSFYKYYAGKKGIDENSIEGFSELESELKELVRWSWGIEENKCRERKSPGWFRMRARQANMTPEERALDMQREKEKYERRKEKREQDRLTATKDAELAAKNKTFWERRSPAHR